MGIVYEKRDGALTTNATKKSITLATLLFSSRIGDNIRVLLMEAWSHLGYLLLFSKKLLDLNKPRKGGWGEPSQFSQQE